ncbi:hypothetical protein [Cryobacterium ruanii]|uniref:Uncharacterized protein n=1 Tax=Cryobacterium ruanii TaxID=1259197 RepID=A0A4R9ALV9_9MICO|nr:hypothetical protein [Cryobacterium ruanii]TFD65153.1 hypothetical protein E3T47_09830 [Cryobacterium ruanii]
MNIGGETAFKYVMIPDSADVRLFAELLSYGTDLSEARYALDLASDGIEDSPLRDAAVYLVGFAALAYCRTFFTSNVRKSTTDHISIPVELEDLHRLIGAFRNTTIAHSQSELATTFPIGVLDAGTLRVRCDSSDLVSDAPATIAEPLPHLSVLGPWPRTKNK